MQESYPDDIASPAFEKQTICSGFIFSTQEQFGTWNLCVLLFPINVQSSEVSSEARAISEYCGAILESGNVPFSAAMIPGIACSARSIRHIIAIDSLDMSCSEHLLVK
ncbi:MAG: hypothetical protein QG605_821 [Euryarchaeota archaeon]|nr:hypothetical protein [Euryarchaeota archaeon]